ncbi:retrotransposon protein, putative, ty1-copia subclass, partial [Tanacetum coccineum]
WVVTAEVELQLGKKIKALRSDRGGEYLSQEFKDYLCENGIVQNLTFPYTPQQNGVSKRRNRTLLDMVRSMFNLTTLPLSFWDYALESAIRILNMVPTKMVDKTPYEIWHGKAPNLSYLKVWGCEAYVKRDSADKLQQRSVKCIFVGYPKETMGYYVYFPSENKVIVARSERTKRAPNRLCLNMEVEDDEVGDLGEPANYKTAMLDPDKMNLSRGKHIHDLRKLRNYLGRLFMKILEKLHTFGIKIYEIDLSVDWTIKCLHLYKILKKFSMQNSKKGFIPMEVKHDLSNEMCASSDEKKAYMKKVPYASVSVDLSCMLSGGTRPDVESSSKLGSDSFIQR